MIAASGKQGITSVVHCRCVVALLYASWEDRYRGRIARECGLKKNELTSDLFHYLNRYRQAILHAGGTLQEEPKVLRFFRKGEVVSLTDDHMDTIFRMLVDGLNRIGLERYGESPGFDFDKRLNN